MKTIIIFLCGFCLLFCANAENLLFNGDFELGLKGYSVSRLLRPDTNPELKFIPLRADTKNVFKGKSSLKLENPNAEYFCISSAQFILPGKSKVIFKGAMRTDIPGGTDIRISLFNSNKETRGTTLSKNFHVDGNWKTFTYSATTPPRVQPYVLYVRYTSKDMSAGNLWMDDFSVTMADDRKEDAPLEICLQPKQKIFEHPDEEKGTVELNIHNRSNKKITDVIGLKCPDQGIDEKISLQIEPGEIKQFTRQVPLARFGIANIKIGTQKTKAKTLSLPYAVIGKCNYKKIDISRDFCVGLNGGSYYYTKFCNNPGYVSRNSSIDDFYSMISRMGCRIIRDHDGGYKATSWFLMEPEEGKFDFSHFDKTIDIMERNGIILLPCFGKMVERMQSWQNENSPAWLRKKLIPVKKNPPNVMKKLAGKVKLPPMEYWERYVSAFTARAKGRIPFYEVMNEPNLSLGADTYCKYLKVAYESIKKCDPDAGVLGFCITGDLGGRMEGFLEYGVNSGAINYCDGVSFHPYNARELGSPVSADYQIGKLKEILPPNKRGKLYNTELYYLFDCDSKNYLEQGDARPEYAACRFLTDLGENCRQSIDMNLEQIWSYTYSPGIARHYVDQDITPNENYIACNALARLFEGAKPVFKKKYLDGIICYVYKKDGELIAAVWNYNKIRGIKLDLRSFKSLDVFGNPIKTDTITVNSSPIYLLPKNKQFMEKLENLPLQVEQSVIASPVLRYYDGHACTTLYNISSKPVTVDVGLSGAMHALKSEKVTIPPLGCKDVSIRAEGKAGKIKINIYCNGKMVSYPVTSYLNQSAEISESLNLDHDLANIKVGCNTDKLIISGQVNDKSNSGKDNAYEPWMQDSVEIFLDLMPLHFQKYNPDAYGSSVFRVFVLPRKDKGKQLVFQPGKTDIKAEELDLKLDSNEKGYRFQLTLPLKFKPRQIGFEAIVNDSYSNSGKVDRKTSWARSQKAYKDRCEFGIIDLEKRSPQKQTKENRKDTCWNFESPSSKKDWDPGRQGMDHDNIKIIDCNDFLEGKKCLQVLQPDGKSNFAVYSPPFPITPGCEVELKFWAKSSQTMQLGCLLFSWDENRKDGPNFRSQKRVMIHPGWQHYELKFKVSELSDKYPTLASGSGRIRFFFMNKQSGEFFLDNVITRITTNKNSSLPKGLEDCQ